MIEEILKRTEEMLSTARLGRDDMFSTDRTRRMSGLRNLIVFGRSVTFTLQNLNSKAPGFEEWYAVEQGALKEDPLMKYFVDLRNEVLKQGKLNVGTTVHANFNTNDLSAFPPPPGAVAFFIGDQIGGSGWEIELADGSKEKYYVSLPESIATVKQVFVDMPPDKYLSLHGRSVEDLSEEYLQKLGALVDRAKAKFGTQPAPKPRPHLVRVK